MDSTSSHLKSELVVGLTAYRYFNNKIGDLYVLPYCYGSLNWSVNHIFQLLEIDYVSKEIGDSGLLFLFRTDYRSLITMIKQQDRYYFQF